MVKVLRSTHKPSTGYQPGEIISIGSESIRKFRNGVAVALENNFRQRLSALEAEVQLGAEWRMQSLDKGGSVFLKNAILSDVAMKFNNYHSLANFTARRVGVSAKHIVSTVLLSVEEKVAAIRREANERAVNVLQEAEKQAKKIIQDAEREADETVQKATDDLINANGNGGKAQGAKMAALRDEDESDDGHAQVKEESEKEAVTKLAAKNVDKDSTGGIDDLPIGLDSMLALSLKAPSLASGSSRRLPLFRERDDNPQRLPPPTTMCNPKDPSKEWTAWAKSRNLEWVSVELSNDKYPSTYWICKNWRWIQDYERAKLLEDYKVWKGRPEDIDSRRRIREEQAKNLSEMPDESWMRDFYNILKIEDKEDILNSSFYVALSSPSSDNFTPLKDEEEQFQRRRLLLEDDDVDDEEGGGDEKVANAPPMYQTGPSYRNFRRQIRCLMDKRDELAASYARLLSEVCFCWTRSQAIATVMNLALEYNWDLDDMNSRFNLSWEATTVENLAGEVGLIPDGMGENLRRYLEDTKPNFHDTMCSLSNGTNEGTSVPVTESPTENESDSDDEQVLGNDATTSAQLEMENIHSRLSAEDQFELDLSDVRDGTYWEKKKEEEWERNRLAALRYQEALARQAATRTSRPTSRSNARESAKETESLQPFEKRIKPNFKQPKNVCAINGGAEPDQPLKKRGKTNNKRSKKSAASNGEAGKEEPPNKRAKSNSALSKKTSASNASKHVRADGGRRKPTSASSSVTSTQPVAMTTIAAPNNRETRSRRSAPKMLQRCAESPTVT